MSSELLISVIVPVRDHPDGVKQLVACLSSQTLAADRFEVIIADDGSTEELPKLLTHRCRSIRVTRGAASNSYVARNRAAKLARGQLLAFTDADCLPRTDWLARGAEALRWADIVGGHVELLLPARATTWAIIDATLFDQARFVAMGKAATANLFVSRTLFEQHGGFDPTQPSGGDWDFVERCVRSGARLAYAPDAVVEHPTRSGPLEFLRRRWRIEHAMARRFTGRELTFRAVNSAREPVVPRRWGFAVGYDESRLIALGVSGGWRTRLRTLPARYLLIPPVEALAQITGWLGARLRAFVVRSGSSSAAGLRQVDDSRRT